MAIEKFRYRIRRHSDDAVAGRFFTREAAIHEMWREAERTGLDVDIERLDDDMDWVFDGGTIMSAMYPLTATQGSRASGG